jgi:hypothetical protein
MSVAMIAVREESGMQRLPHCAIFRDGNVSTGPILPIDTNTINDLFKKFDSLCQ